MNIEEYKAAIAEIESDASGKKRLIARKFARANNKVKTGDIIEDHYQKIKVVGFAISYNREWPQCVYMGSLLTKAGKPFKNGKQGSVHQSNLKEVIEG